MAIDAALGRLGNKSGVCTSSTRPTNPFEGQLIYETDTNRTLVYDNAAWVVVADNQVLSIDTTNSRVGIGTTLPAKKLHVKGDNEGIRIEDGGATDHYDIYRNDTTGYLEFTGSQTSFSGYDFEVNNGTNVMRINNSGNVGIGDTTPSYNLDVNGDINLTGDLRYAGTVHKRVVFGGSAIVNVATGADTAWVKYVDITPTAPFTGYMYIQFMGNTGFNATGKETTVGWGDTSAAYGNLYHNFRTYPTAAHWSGVSFHYLFGVTSGVAADAAIWISHDSAGGTTYLRGTYKYWWIET